MKIRIALISFSLILSAESFAQNGKGRGQDPFADAFARAETIETPVEQESSEVPGSPRTGQKPGYMKRLDKEAPDLGLAEKLGEIPHKRNTPEWQVEAALLAEKAGRHLYSKDKSGADQALKQALKQYEEAAKTLEKARSKSFAKDRKGNSVETEETVAFSKRLSFVYSKMQSIYRVYYKDSSKALECGEKALSYDEANLSAAYEHSRYKKGREALKLKKPKELKNKLSKNSQL